MLLTIFTPTYNRAFELDRLYNSLLSQTNKNFEWVIVDDGSIDNTEDKILEYINQNNIFITYFKQNNSGKHIAINKGVELAKGELFFIVDSDDFLLDNAVEKILKNYIQIENRNDIAGLSFRRGYNAQTPIGSNNFKNNLICNVLDFRFRHKVVGDMAEIFKLNVLKEYSFPTINEKFCPESLIWNRIGNRYSFYWVPEIIYIGEYLPDGLTSKIFQIRKRSPINTLTYYSELEKMNIPFFQKLKANINYWRFAKYSKFSVLQHFQNTNLLLNFFGLPLSLIFLIKDKN